MVAEFVVEEISLTSLELTSVCRQQATKALVEMEQRHGDKSYHNPRHIGRTILSSLAIAQDMGAPERHQACLVFAAAYHDIELAKSSKGENERLSGEIAVENARQVGIFHGRDFTRIANLVQATETYLIDGRLVQEPKTWLQRALCDGDLIDLRSENQEFISSAQGIYEELCNRFSSWQEDKDFVAIEAEILEKTQPHWHGTAALFPHQASNLAETLKLLQPQQPD
jgi:hypothetical protein